MVKVGKTQPPQEIKPQRGVKQPRVTQMRLANEGEKRGDHRVVGPAWAPRMKLDGASLLSDASIRDFQRGTAGYVVDAVEQSLLLPKDMADLRSIRQHEVFLSLKRDLAIVSLFFFFLNNISFLFQAIQAIFRAEEMVNYSHRKMKEEEGRRIATVDAFQVVEKSNQELRASCWRRSEREKALQRPWTALKDR